MLVSAAELASVSAPPAAFSCLHEVVENTMAKVAIPKTIHFSRQVFIRVAESVPNGANLRLKLAPFGTQRDEPLSIPPRTWTSTPLTNACRKAGCGKSARPV